MYDASGAGVGGDQVGGPRSSTTTVNEGDVITYTLTFANTAGQAPATVNHTDDLSGVLDDATVTTPPASRAAPG